MDVRRSARSARLEIFVAAIRCAQADRFIVLTFGQVDVLRRPRIRIAHHRFELDDLTRVQRWRESLSRDLVASIDADGTEDAVVEQKVLAFVIIGGAERTERGRRRLLVILVGSIAFHPVGQSNDGVAEQRWLAVPVGIGTTDAFGVVEIASIGRTEARTVRASLGTVRRGNAEVIVGIESFVWKVLTLLNEIFMVGLDVAGLKADIVGA